MAEIHTKKHLEENSGVTSTEMSTQPVKKGGFFSQLLWILALIFIITIGAGAYGYYKFSHVIVDNPSTNKITVVINDKTLEIAPESSVTTMVGVGTHTVTVDDKNIGTFEKQINATNMINAVMHGSDIINPLEFPYFIDYAIYGGSGQNTISPKIIGDLHIPSNSWDYGLDEKFPDSLTTRFRTSSSITKKKIFRFYDFAKEYNYTEKELLIEVYGEDAVKDWFSGDSAK